ncbi:MAG TPA: histidine phosphatase family protein [Actinomycetes bacterium]|nr:histidine phosphatase family protein [Actinomycetes bacterium]
MSDADPTSRRLVLVRHAKAEPGGEDADHDRRLTDRGLRDAADAGRWLATVVRQVDEVWCSSAVRAVQTWDAIAPSLVAPPPSVERELYLAGARDLVGRLERVRPGRIVLLVGHNPTAEQLLAAVVGELRGLRPGAVAVADLDAGSLVDSWSPAR